MVEKMFGCKVTAVVPLLWPVQHLELT
jgi:hypothetical protein